MGNNGKGAQGAPLKPDELRTEAKRLRNVLRISQEHVARELGCSLNTYRGFEIGPPNGSRTMRAETMKALQGFVDHWGALEEIALPWPESIRQAIRETSGYSDNEIVALLIRARQIGRGDLVDQLLAIIEEIAKADEGT